MQAGGRAAEAASFHSHGEGAQLPQEILIRKNYDWPRNISIA
jgi:hypothetical protein